MKSFLRLIRYQNLLMIAFTLWMTAFCIIKPLLELYHLQQTFTNLDITIIILAWVCIAAGGYVINDYFDTQTDRINRPDTQVIGKTITHGSATTYHIAFSITGCILGFMVSARIGVWKFGFIYPIIVGMLWFYSSAYKKMFLVGNLVVSFVTAFGITIPALYEMPGQFAATSEVVQYGVFDPYILFYTTSAFAVFAFITTLAREIIKDLEDVEGDRILGAKTIPIVLGNTVTKIIVCVLIAITIGGLIYAYNKWMSEVHATLSACYITIGIILPLLFLAYKVITIKERKDCHFCSTLMKIIMLMGICYMFVARYIYVTFRDEF